MYSLVVRVILFHVGSTYVRVSFEEADDFDYLL